MHKTPKLRQTPVPRAYPSRTFTCVTCEMEIRGRPTFWVGLAFCCAGCAVNGPCTCSYDFDFDLGYELEPVEREPVLA